MKLQLSCNVVLFCDLYLSPTSPVLVRIILPERVQNGRLVKH